MKIENQVCTQTQAKKLSELGVVQKSWHCWFTGDTGNNVDHLLTNKGIEQVKDSELCYAAFTVAELGILIGKNYNMPTQNAEGLFDGKKPKYFKFKTEAEGRADLLIDLLDYNAESSDEVNTRLLNS